jgi:hypothetical protein
VNDRFLITMRGAAGAASGPEPEPAAAPAPAPAKPAPGACTQHAAVRCTQRTTSVLAVVRWQWTLDMDNGAQPQLLARPRK